MNSIGTTLYTDKFSEAPEDVKTNKCPNLKKENFNVKVFAICITLITNDNNKNKDYKIVKINQYNVLVIK